MKRYIKAEKFMRCNPLMIFENTSKYFMFLLLPLLRALFTVSGGLSAWVQGAWFDLIIIGLIISLGLYQWYCMKFSFKQHGIYAVKGIFLRQKKYIPYEKISAIFIQKPWFYAPIKMVRVHIDTDAGGHRNFDFYILVKKKSLDEIISKLETVNVISSYDAKAKKTIVPRNLYIAIFSFVTSDSLTGVLYVITAVSQFGNIFSEDIEYMLVSNFTDIASQYTFGLPVIVAVISYAILTFWLIAFITNIIGHLKFEVKRNKNYFHIKYGLLTKNENIVENSHINFLLIRQTLLTKIMGYFSVLIDCTGYGKSKNQISVLLPAGEAEEIESNLKFLFGELPIVKRQVTPKRNNFFRFVSYPSALVLLILAVCLVLLHFMAEHATLIIFAGIAVLVPAVWWLIVKFYSFFFTGIGTRDNIVTLYYTKGFGIYTSCIYLDRIVDIRYIQTPIQQLTEGCDINIYTYSERVKKQTVASLNVSEAKKFFKYLRENKNIEISEEGI